ncbi:MAG TPA: ABC transporter permease [Patescibacteria group bacterium]|nr:ABC transporter permease [Patescibacteria group bacterium]
MLRDFAMRLRSLFRRSTVEHEMDDELRLHIERQTEKYTAVGVPHEEAARRARIELGGLDQVREECRDARGTRWLETLLEDLHYSLRTLRSSPAFATVAVLTLALGIGANAAVLSLVNAVLWRPLPYPEASQLLSIHEVHSRAANLTGATFHDLELESHSFSEVACLRILPRNLGDSRNGTPPEEIGVAVVSRDFFRLLKTQPLLGRTFSEEDYRANGPRAIVLSYALWQRRYHANAGIVGTMEIVHGRPYLLAGVMPRAFTFPKSAEAWAALQDDAAVPDNRRAHLFLTIARLRPEFSLAQARGDLHAVAARVMHADPTGDPGLDLAAEPLERNLNAPVRPALLMLLSAVALVLVMACVNVANLQISRAAVRQKNIAVRAALGASRGRLVQQLLTESGLLGLLGGAAGCFAGAWLVRVALAAYPGALPHSPGPALDGKILALAACIAIAAAVVSGAVPALQLVRGDLRNGLAAAGRTTGPAAGQRLRSALVIWEIALALILVVSAGLLVRTITSLARVNPGYQSSGLLVVPISLPGVRYPEIPQWQRFVDTVLDKMQNLPGVQSVAATGAMPFRPTPSSDFEVEGHRFAPGDEPEAQIITVTPEFFSTMGIRLLAGRAFTNRDVLGVPTAIVINETMARQFWANESPLGKRLVLKDWGDPLAGEIVGIAADAKQDALDQPPQPTVYYSMAQFPQGTLTTYLLIRAAGPPEALAAGIRRCIWTVDSALPVQVQSFEQVIAGTLERRRFTLAILGAFAAIALVLAVVGIYGLVAYLVEQRTRELGIRMALGAQGRDILRLVLREGFGLTVRGLAIGALAALAFTRLLAGLLFGVQTADPLTYAASALFLGAATLAACWIPARRAMRTDPLLALRNE